MSDKWPSEFFEKLTEEILLAELTRMLIETTNECGETSNISHNPNFRRLMLLLCAFGISITNKDVREQINKIIDNVELEIDGTDDDEIDFMDKLKEQKWWDN